MAIKIEKITVKNLGPIRDFTRGMGQFNLVFSKNECGKTFLTEFIIRSLFKNIKRWQFRENGSGKVTLSGLDGDGGISEFSPGTPKKLEDYWEKDERGLPLSLVKLLVSKGGEAAIEATDDGIGKSLIKEIFSGISLLDSIDSDSNISRTIKGAQFDEGNINIGNTGEGRTYRQLKSDLEHLDGLSAEVESTYAAGVLAAYRTQEKLLKNNREKLYKAKCHTAYLLSENIKKLNGRLAQNDEDGLNRIAGNISIYERAMGEYEEKARQIEDFNRKCQDYEWLQRALPLYEKFSAAAFKRPGIVFAILSGVFALAAIIFSIFGIAAGTITALVIASGLAAYYVIRTARLSRNAGSGSELENLKKEFKQRTGADLTGIATLSLERDKQKEFYDQSRLLKDQMDGLRLKNQDLKGAIQQDLYNLTGRQAPESQWHSMLIGKKDENRSIRAEIESLREKLSDLAIRDIEYLAEDPGIIFSYDEYERAGSELEQIEVKIQEIETNINNLKYIICRETNDDQSIDWQHLLENLKQKRFEKQKEYKNIEAQIIAGIIVHSEVAALRQEEDKKIYEGLQSDIVLKPLAEITSRYMRLSLDGETLMVSDDYKDYCIRDLSTGAREQVMLALRIGFASKILKQDTLFLILDDAFQHSDWERRQVLVDKLADIAASGWQIIYFSMDNHIRDLFDKAGGRFKKGEYKCIELT